MREIKFRAWDGKVMTYPKTVELGVNGWNGQISVSYQLDNGGYCTTSYLMQYTGLKDKNGKEIYEGDICLDRDWGQTQRAVSIVTYQGYQFVLKKPKSTAWYEWYPIKDQEGNNVEVIGNIYENPELIANNH